MDNKNLKLRAWFLVSLGIVICGAALYYSYSKLNAIFTDYSINFLYSIGESRAEQVKLFLEGKQNRVVDFSSDGFIKNSLYDIKHSRNKEETMEKLSYHLTVNKLPVDKHFYKVMTLGINGAVVASTDDASVGVDFAGDPVFLEGRTRPYVKSLSYDDVSNVKSFVLAAPVLRENEFVGVVVIKMLPDVLMDIMTRENNLGERVETYIINENGYLVTPSRFLEGKNKGILTQIIDTENSKKCLKDLDEYMEKGAVHQFENDPTMFVDYKGEYAIGSHHIIPEVNWCLLAEADKTTTWVGGKRGLVAALFLLFIGVGLVVLHGGLLVAGRKNVEQQ